MALVVTGVSQDGDTKALQTALGAAGLSLDPLQIIGPDESTQGVSRGLVGADLLLRDSGTGVPGINNSHNPGAFFRNESVPDRLGDLEIPDSEIENYAEALERGHSVIAYFAHDDTVDRVEALFREAALRNVRRF